MINSTDNALRIHHLLDLIKEVMQINFLSYWFCEDEFQFCWGDVKNYAQWDFQLSFPDLETMMAYINQQIEIHEQFLARFSE